MKAKKLYTDLFSLVGDKLTALSELEVNKCGDIDKVADTFASLLGELFASHHLLDEQTKRILYKMGYSLGRFIYILDAYDDLEEDKKKKRYNPFIYIENKLNPSNEDEENIIHESEDTYIIKGITPLSDIEDELGISFEEEDYDTLNGYLINKLDRIPSEDEKIELETDGIKFEVLAIEGKMISLVRLTVLENDADISEEDSEQ